MSRSYLLLPVVAGLALLGIASALTGQEGPLASGLVRDLELTVPPGTRMEYFRLDAAQSGLPAQEDVGADGSPRALADEASDLPEGPRPIGVVRWLGGPDPEVEGGWRGEVEVRLFETRTRVLHSERLGPSVRKLVFREIRARSGRTLHLAWKPDGSARLAHTTGGEVRRSVETLERRTQLPLGMIEYARRGALVPGRYPVFEPLAGRVGMQDIALEGPANERSLQAKRTDGSVAGEWRFRGSDLVGFRWQAGGPLATAISADEYERWVANLDQDASVYGLAANDLTSP